MGTAFDEAFLLEFFYGPAQAVLTDAVFFSNPAGECECKIFALLAVFLHHADVCFICASCQTCKSWVLEQVSVQLNVRQSGAVQTLSASAASFPEWHILLFC